VVRARKGEKERVGKEGRRERERDEELSRGREEGRRVAGSLGWLGNRQKEAAGGW
jgi:hypothetical protein